LPTAGPAFYSLVTGDPDRFHKVRDFVGTTAGTFSSAADEQRYLWALHLAGSDGFGSGISAFPSMHVALISLMAMFATEHNRRLGIAAWVYVAFIVASSTYLGWHYAVDGYAAIILVAMVYWAVRSAPALWRAMVPAIETAPVPVPVPSPLPVAADPELAAG
jgi:membrane-associated phospholipid phosphatase